MLYEGECSAHGRFEEVQSVNEYVLNAGLLCPKCGHKARTVLHAPPTIGPMPSKPLVIDQIGQTFHSRAEEREYFKRRPDRRIVDPSDSSFLKLKDKAREDAEKMATRQGFRDLDDRRVKVKAQQARKKAIAGGDRKIQADVG